MFGDEYVSGLYLLVPWYIPRNLLLQWSGMYISFDDRRSSLPKLFFSFPEFRGSAKRRRYMRGQEQLLCSV